MTEGFRDRGNLIDRLADGGTESVSFNPSGQVCAFVWWRLSSGSEPAGPRG